MKDPTLSTAVYLIKDGKWLMLLRNKKEHDVNHGKWIGVGGKNLKDESFHDCAIRETREETGLIMDNPVFRGFLYFEYMDSDSEKIAVYTGSRFHGTMLDTVEGTLKWIPEPEILNLDLWEGDRVFLKRILKDNNEMFAYRMCYDSSSTLRHFEEMETEHE